MRWIKHYTNAHKSETMQRLFAEFGKARGYGLYWLFTDYFADKWDGIHVPMFIVLKNELS